MPVTGKTRISRCVYFTEKRLTTGTNLFLNPFEATKNPALLEVYGGFGTISGPHYETGLLYFLDKGGVYAYAEVRGGGEKGLKWHTGGKGMKRQIRLMILSMRRNS